MDILILSLALSADAFGAALAVGMRRMGMSDRLVLSAAVGIMHVLMPLASITAGSELYALFGDILYSLGGIVLALTGIQMILSLFKEEETIKKPAGLGVFVFAFGVSIDSFSTGLSLGVLGVDKAVAVASFGICTTIITMAGLLLSSRVNKAAGKAGEAAGGLLLLLIGIKWVISL